MELYGRWGIKQNVVVVLARDKKTNADEFRHGVHDGL